MDRNGRLSAEIGCERRPFSYMGVLRNVGLTGAFFSRSSHLLSTRAIAVVSISLSFLTFGGCRRAVSAKPIGATVHITQPLGLPPVPIPPANPPTAQTIALGRLLFYDPRLSKDDTIACASCHMPALSFADGAKRSRGVGGMLGARNAPSIVNAAYLPLQFWDGRASSLEEQAAAPISNPIEMNQPHDVSVAKLARDPRYTSLFQQSFGPGGMTLERIENAIASFERTVLSGNSAFDRYEYGGDKTTLTASQTRGLQIFTDKARGNCSTCHLVNATYALFTDGKAHNIGVGAGDAAEFSDVGRFAQTRANADRGAFITPMLRDVARTAPYMHDGSLKTLKDVVDFYAGGGNSNPYLDKEIRAIKLSAQDRKDLVAFLESLNGEYPDNIGPPAGR
jgi:cytochrome c peroxidase